MDESDSVEGYALKELFEAEMLRVEKHVARCPKYRYCPGRTVKPGGGWRPSLGKAQSDRQSWELLRLVLK